MFRAFLNAITIQRSGFWLWMLALGAVVFTTFAVGLMAFLFSSSMVSGLGILLMVVGAGVMLGTSLSLETVLKRRGEEIPSWLMKGNRVLISICLGWAVTQVFFQLAMELGRTFHFYPHVWFWVLGADFLIMVLATAAGFFALSFKAEVGKEFGIGMALLLVVSNGIMAMVNFGSSLVDPAINGQLYLVYQTDSCAQEPGHEYPTVVHGWELSVYQRNLFGDNVLWDRNFCVAEQVNLDHPVPATRQAHLTAVRKAQREADANQSSNLLQVGIWSGVALSGLFGLLVVTGFSFHILKGVWTGTVGVTSIGMVLFLMVSTVWCCGLGSLSIAEMLGLNVDQHADDLGRRLSGAPPLFHEPFNVEPQSSVRVGQPPGDGSVYICQCGDEPRQVWVESNWHSRAKYNRTQYGMHAQGCGGMWNVDADNVYRIWNKSGTLTPVMKIMAAGSSWTCPDGTVLAPR